MAQNTDFSVDAKQQLAAHQQIRQTRGEKIFTVCNYTFFAILSLIVIYPFWHEIMLSFSDTNLAAAGGAFLWPKQFTTSTFRTVLGDPKIWSGFRVSIIVTVFGTILSTMVTAMMAYALSHTKLPGSAVIMLLVLFTMLFNGGMIPNYLLLKALDFQDKLFALIFPNMISAYNIIIMRSFFVALPPSIEESAQIDGANDITIFFRLIVPISMAPIATIALFVAVTYWNDYLSTVLYITTQSKWSLQAVLRAVLLNTAQAMRESGIDVTNDVQVSEETVKASMIVITTVPILIVYPFLQKYFVKGVMVGSVKG